MKTILEISQYLQSFLIILGSVTGIIGFCTKKGQAWIQKKYYHQY